MSVERRFWPFISHDCLNSIEIQFLDECFLHGFSPHVTGVSDCCATSQAGRFGTIVVRGRKAWEVGLAELDCARLTVYLNDFSVAEKLVLGWLLGENLEGLTEDLKDHFASLSGLSRQIIFHT